MSIEVAGLRKNYGSFVALDSVNLRVEDGELMVLLGPSGCGKTTLLRIIAGLEQADAGAVQIDERPATQTALRDRNIGFVFQHYALFRHMTVAENVAFGLQVRPRFQRPSKAAIRAKVEEVLHLVQLEWAAKHYPHELSGGQRQRVALGRVLAVEPRLLLLDEPFGALDAMVRRELRRWLRHLHDDLAITSILVTHDQEEALEVADRVVVMNEGRIVQLGTPDEVYTHPATPFVCTFLGASNLFHGRFEHGRAIIGDTPIHVSDLPDMRDAPTDSDGVKAVFFVRPHDIGVTRERSPDYPVAATVQAVQTIGPSVRLVLGLAPGQIVEAELPVDAARDLALRLGEAVYLKFNNPKAFVKDR